MIYNNNLDVSISIDESEDRVQFTPRDYDENPYVLIELRSFNLVFHSKSCKDCQAFVDAFCTNSLDWYIMFEEKKFRLDMRCKNMVQSQVYSELKLTISDYNPGTQLTLALQAIPAFEEELKHSLEIALRKENYEKACVIRDLLKDKGRR